MCNPVGWMFFRIPNAMVGISVWMFAPSKENRAVWGVTILKDCILSVTPKLTGLV